jgi:ArpU family phage transcriptional regulator
MVASLLIDKLSAKQKNQVRDTVENELEKYRIYKYTKFEKREASINQSYTERFHGPTNVTSDQTAIIATYNVDEPGRRKAYCERLEHLVGRLPPKERKIVAQGYMGKQKLLDDLICYEVCDPPISHCTLRNIKNNAMLKIAAALYIDCGFDWNIISL